MTIAFAIGLLGTIPRTLAAPLTVATHTVTAQLKTHTLTIQETLLFERPVSGLEFKMKVPSTVINKPVVHADTKPLATIITHSTGLGTAILSTEDTAFFTRVVVSYQLPPRFEHFNKQTTWRWTPLTPQSWLIKQSNISATLPFTIEPDRVTLRAFSTTSTLLPTNQPSLKNNQVVHAVYTDIDPHTTLTLVSGWSDHVWAVSWQDNFRLLISNLARNGIWQIVTVALAIITLCGGSLIARIITDRVPKRPVPTTLNLPSNLAPLMVRTLWQKRIDPQGLTATLVDLAQRGYVAFVVMPSGFQISRRRPFDSNVKEWEIQLLEQVFMTEVFKVGKQTLLHRIRAHFITPQMKFVYYDVNKILFESGYFTDHPQMTIIRVKLIGLFLYTVTCITLIVQIIRNAPAQASVPLIPLLLAIMLFLRLTRHAAERSPAGRATTADWLAFGRLLRSKKLIETNQTELFYTYLPYAIALNCVKEWSNRFRGLALPYPKWLDYGSVQHETSELTTQVLNSVQQLTKMLQTLRGPTAE